MLHGDMLQLNRQNSLRSFKEKKSNILIASDVAGRGLDINSISHVINFDVPNNPEDYIHRIGRTGRAGNKGTSITLFSEEDKEMIEDLIVSAVNQALQSANKAAEEKMSSLTGGISSKIKFPGI